MKIPYKMNKMIAISTMWNALMNVEIILKSTIILQELRLSGHNVLYVSEFVPSIDDEKVLDQANQNCAILLTEDKDFGELVYRQRRVHMAVVLIRLSGLSTQEKAKNYLNRLCKSRERIGACLWCYYTWKN